MSFLLGIPSLFVIGMVLAYIVFKKHRSSPDKTIIANRIIVPAGIVIVGIFLAVSIPMYLGFIGVAGIAGPDFMLNSGIPFLNFERSLIVDLIAAFLFLLYPVALFAGAGLAMNRLGLYSRKILSPVVLPLDKSLIVVADTHLGLRRNALLRALNKGPESEPAVIGSFLEWLIRSSNTEKSTGKDISSSQSSPEGLASTKVPVWDESRGQVVDRLMRAPEHVVLLGDIMEMWDSQDESVSLALTTTFSKLNRLDAEVVFVTGNHDQVFERDVTTTSGIRGEIRITSDVWPDSKAIPSSEKGEPGMRPVLAGKRRYLFLHGHQFDTGFQLLGPVTHIPGHLRRAARLGNYMWLFAILFLTSLVAWSLGAFSGHEVIASIMIIVLFLLALPIIYLVIGRYLWRKISGSRYHRERALKGFSKWWKTQVDQGTALQGEKKGLDDLVVVYGHTHVTDIIDGRNIGRIRPLGGLRAQGASPLLLNVPAWTNDPKHGLERAFFLYVDNGRHLFLGWDWRASRPFHIPDALIHARREGLDLNGVLIREKMTLDDLKKLGWPDKFMKKWAEVLDYRNLPA
jgi:UDP-2,3-diacylglucosamine pyrophosphatase LpxH